MCDDYRIIEKSTIYEIFSASINAKIYIEISWNGKFLPQILIF